MRRVAPILLALVLVGGCGGGDGVERTQPAAELPEDPRPPTALQEQALDAVGDVPDGFDVETPRGDSNAIVFAWVNRDEAYEYPPTVAVRHYRSDLSAAEDASERLTTVRTTLDAVAVQPVRTVAVAGAQWTRIAYDVELGAAGQLRAVAYLSRASSSIREFGWTADARESASLEPRLREMLASIDWARVPRRQPPAQP